MADKTHNRTIAGVLAVKTQKQIKRDLLGRVTEETKRTDIGFAATVPPELIDAAKAISDAAPKLAGQAARAGAAIKGHVAPALKGPKR